jgi:ribosomal protein S12 methylthiotransferase
MKKELMPQKNIIDDVPEDVKQARADEIMELQQQVSAELNRQKIGQNFKVLIDRRENGFFVGRTEFDSPEVDGEVGRCCMEIQLSGDFRSCQIWCSSPE